MSVPYLDVAHLPSSASFFASVLQPLGWHFTAPDRHPDSLSAGSESPGFVEFGINGVPVLRVRQRGDSSLNRAVPLTDLSIAAPSRAAVIAFHQAGLRANPALHLTSPLPHPGSTRDTTSYSSTDGIHRAMLHDLDGNRVEAVYPDPHPAGGDVKYSGSAVRETQSTQSEVGRILHWNYDVASSSPRSTSSSRMSRRQQDGPAPLRRSLTHGSQPLSSEHTHADTDASAREGAKNGGLNTTTVVGALLGAAAGAGLLYSAWNSREKTRDPSHDRPSAPVLPRRSTLPEMPMGINSRVHQLDQKSGIEDLAHREYIYAGGSSRKSSRDEAKVRDLYTDPWSSRPRSIVNPWTQDSPLPRTSLTRTTPPRARALDDNFDGRSRHSTRYNGGRTSEVRTRSAGPSARGSVVEREERPSRSSSRRGSVAARSRSRTHDTDRESYTSARTHRTSSTSRPPLSRPPPVEYETVVRSRAASRSSGLRTPKASTQDGMQGYFGRPNSYVSARNVPLPMSDVSARHIPLPMSEVSARHVPLPRSSIGSSHANWDDDLDSVVPDDSISCVGSKSSRRSRQRH
ncbi:hypothetical protein NLU13_5435 [Sarocladium strictum]|uniref:VOC domain-containing protein n=1 Tax=Sarocladium strictum TaxID=5046 RepID=A0AA39L7M6_SARSR|nr:hypothetical protein NLU13_5435 [Sarocladium strictum]